MVIYEGPSQIDGKPIVAIVTTSSKNSKMESDSGIKVMQTWILAADMSPTDAVKTGADRSVCGDCPHRHHTGGACYVIPFQAPRSVWAAWKRGSYDKPERAAKVERELGRSMIRLGAYGDPAAVPWTVWRDLVARAAHGHTGYTHQWRLPIAAGLRGLCMASVDSPEEDELAKSKGWRTFLATDLSPESIDLQVSGSIECLSDARGTSCADCGICDGSRLGRDKQPTSVWITMHGARAKRPSALKVIK